MEKQKIQKYRNSLVMAGRALIIFGAWDVLYNITGLLYKSADIQFALSMFAPDMQPFIKEITIIALVLICAIDVWIRLVIGLRAIREGKQRTKKRRYCLLSFGVGAVYILLLCSSIPTIVEGKEMYTYILAGIGNLISIFLYFRIPLLAMKIRRYDKKAKSEIDL